MRGKKSSAGLVGVLAIVTANLLALSASAVAQTETVLLSFGAPPAPSRGGTYPEGRLIFDAKGNLYGTTSSGGHSQSCIGGCGVVFQLTPKGVGGWNEKLLHTFNYDGSDGIFPSAGLVFDAAGNLYGTTQGGGLYGDGSPFTGGTVFELSPSTGGSWTEKILFNFEGGIGNGVGDSPSTGVIFDKQGNLYGATNSAGSIVNHGLGCGSVYQLALSAGETWTATALHTFLEGNDGCDGYALTLDAAGNVYGVSSGGANNRGLVFELISSGGVWSFQILDNFSSSEGPRAPDSLVFDSHGNLYGASYGTGSAYKYGTVFELTPGTGGTWTQSIAYAFGSLSDGYGPNSLTFDAAGNLYGVTSSGGTYNRGTVFKLTPSSSGVWTKTILHNFASGLDGKSPNGLALGASGDLYGTTYYGGLYNYGMIFKIVP